ncbi:MAG: AMP-binding protein, partial [Gemmatimonadota bacterium]|nr:AMP-binding protein [Gemmatimonadota bacterium]
MSDFLAEAARRWPGRAALSGRTRRWSFAEFDTWVSELAERHHGSGPVPRGRILPLVAEATPEGIAALLAGMRAGYTVAPLNPRLTETESRRARQALDGPGDPEGMAVLWTSGTSGVPRGVVLT